MEHKILGPLRGVVCAYRWTKVYEYQLQYRYEDVVDVTEGICRLQPHVVEAWDYLAWNLAFNLFVEAGENDDEKWLWLKRGFETLREGLLFNPSNPRLLLGEATTIYLKSQSAPAMYVRMEEWFSRSPKEEAVAAVLASKMLETGQFADVEMCLAILYWSDRDLEIVEACKLLVNRFPSSAKRFEEIVSIVENDP
jgi:hypothetical protein